MRMSLSNVVLIAFLWATAMFAAVGYVFSVYDEASVSLRDSAVRTALTAVHGAIRAELDKGKALPQTETLTPLLEQYTKLSAEAATFFVFDALSGKVLYGSRNAAAGTEVPYALLEKCKAAGLFFADAQGDLKTAGMPVTNALENVVGCVAEQTHADENERDRLVHDAFRAWLRLTLIGLACIAVLYLKSCLPNGKRRFGFAGLAVVLILMLVPSAVSQMCESFEQNLKAPIALKAKTVARTVAQAVEKSVGGGIPFSQIAGTDAFLEQIRKTNPELLFILLTDKTGRVLFENGSTQQAFETNVRTGGVTLKKGYFNAAEPVVANSAAVGWVQIGVNERFVREKIF
ncbi:MAG TPA: hypothetical protein DD624_03410 [Alphaproteobacteria bacterium]|nr:hypothetical protein [Alphaproteobacteria bacterium]